MIGLLRQRRSGAAAKARLVELVNDELGLPAALAGTVLLRAGYPTEHHRAHAQERSDLAMGEVMRC